MERILLSLMLIFGSLITLPCQADVIGNIQEKAIEHLLSIRNIRVSEISDICAPNTSLNQYFNENGLSCQVLSGLKDDIRNDISSLLRSKKSSNGTQKAETYAVSITVLNGYSFHVADYYGTWGNSRVVTALDGELRGRQEIADNGIVMVASTNVKWHKEYFEHTYPAAKVYTYQNKQVLELKQQ